MGPNPRHRFALVAAAVEQDLPAPTDPGEAALHELLRSGTCPNTEVGYAYEIFRIENHRAAVDAFLLAKVDLPTSSKRIATYSSTRTSSATASS